MMELLEDIDNDDFEDYEPELYNTWITQDGRVIPIKDMSTSHIKNCIKMINNNRPTPQHMLTDAAQDLADIEFESSVEYIDTWLEVFQAEIERRRGVVR